MMTVRCPECGVNLKLDEKYIGKKGRCNSCKAVITVPAPTGESAIANGKTDHPFGNDPFSLPKEPAVKPTHADGANPFAPVTAPPAAKPSDSDDDPFRTDVPDDPAETSDPEEESPWDDDDADPFMTEAMDVDDSDKPVRRSAAFSDTDDEIPLPGNDEEESAPVKDDNLFKNLLEDDEEESASHISDLGSAAEEVEVSDDDLWGTEDEQLDEDGAATEQDVLLVNCPNCGIAMEIERKYIGARGRCDECQFVFTVTEPADEPARPDPFTSADAMEDPFAAEEQEATPAAVGFDQPGPFTRAGMATPAGISGSGIESVTIASIEPILVRLPCLGTFLLAGGTYASKGEPTPRVLVKIAGSNGLVGWGEVTPCPTWCYETSETIVSTIAKYLAPAVKGLPIWDREGWTRAMDRVIQPGATIGQPLAKSGIDTAIHDLLARTLQIPLHVLFGSKRLDEVWLSYIVSAHDPDDAVAQVRRGQELGYDAFKIKVGMNNERVDRGIVEAVANSVAKDTFLWVDANQGYELDVAIRQAKVMNRLGVRVFEQPLKGARISAFRRLVALQEVPIALDETLGTPADLVECIKAEAVDLPIAKVQRCGGHWHSSRFCQVAQAAGLRLMASGLCETDLGLAHGIQLFSAFGIDLPCDLNGRQFVQSAYLSVPLDVHNGRVRIPSRPGCGVEVDEAKVRQFAAQV